MYEREVKEEKCLL